MNRLELAPLDLPVEQPSDIVHLGCCLEPDGPAMAFCGTFTEGPAMVADPVCVVCWDLTTALEPGCCPHGGRCPE